MLAKGEFEVVHHEHRKYILCNRLDMLPDIETELSQHTIFGYKCVPEKSNVLKWLELFQALTKTTFVIFSSKSGLPHVVFKARARCHHMVPFRPDRPRKKPSRRDSGCRVALTITAIKNNIRRSRLPIADYSLRVSCNGRRHNHPVRTVEALRHRRVSASSRALLLDLFDKHHSPADALEILKVFLLEEHGDNYPAVADDRHYLPDLGFATRLYYKTYHQRYSGLLRREVRKLRDASHTSIVPRKEKTAAADVCPGKRHLKSRDDFAASFEESEVLGDWYDGDGDITGEVCGESACTDIGQQERTAFDTADGTARAAAACLMGSELPAVAGPSAATPAEGDPVQTARRFRQWAARVSEQIAADASGRTSASAVALMDSWDRPALNPSAALQRLTIPGVDKQPLDEEEDRRRTDALWTRSLCVLRGDDHHDE